MMMIMKIKIISMMTMMLLASVPAPLPVLPLTQPGPPKASQQRFHVREMVPGEESFNSVETVRD